MTSRIPDEAPRAILPEYDVVEISHDRVKPGIPPLLPVSLVIWVACAISYSCFRIADAGVLEIIGISCAAACMACLISVAIFRRALAVMLGAASVLIGLSLASYGAYQIQSVCHDAAGISQRWEFTMLEDSKRGEFGSSCSASAVGENGIRANVRVELPLDSELLQGDIISAKASLVPPKESNAEYFWSLGLAATARLGSYEEMPAAFPSSLIKELRAYAIDVLAEYGGTEASLLQALVCGYRNGIQESGEYETYKTVGLAHLVAVSGAHLAIVTMLFGYLLRKARSPRWLQVLSTMAFVVAYLVFSGIPISALRAAFMVVLSSAAVFAKRRAASLNSLGICVIAFLAADPSTAVSVSFFLSAGSTLGITLFAGLLSSWLSGLPEKAAKLVAEPLGLTLSSNIVTLPYSAALFSQVPLLAPLANIIAAPLFSLACVGGLIGTCAAAAVPAFAEFSIGIAALCAMPLSAAVQAMASVPHACIAVQLPMWPMVSLSAAACIALWLAWPKPRMRSVLTATGALCAAVLVLLFVAPRFNADEIIMLDVGQGDAILIRSGENAVLVDTGNQASKLREGLGRLRVYALDAVVVTHHDDDHMGCLESLASYEDIGAIYSASDALECSCASCADLRRVSSRSCAQGLLGLDAGDRIRVGAFELLVVWPKGYSDEGGNGDSVCLLVRKDCDSDGDADWEALLTGDAESDELAAMLKSKEVSRIDMLKVGHHGSRVALTDEIAGMLSPEIALISAGENNRYGHPSQEALDILQRSGAKVYRTDLDGTVKVEFTSDALIVSSERERLG